MQTLRQVALGIEKADLVIINARLINVYTGEIQENHSIAIKGRCIALVGPDISAAIGKDTKIIDAMGKTVVPGLIDGHAHLASWSTVHEFLDHAMKGGTTTIITESMEVFPVAGYEGVIDFLESLNGQPVKVFATAPAMASISRSAMGVPLDIMEQFAGRKEIIGLGESYWQTVFQAPEFFLSNFEAMLKKGKTLEGHSAGARGNKLAAYAAMGISSCHEPTSAEDALERLRLGLYVMAREGSIRRDLKSISGILDNNISLRRLVLTTDGISPSDLLNLGYLEYPVQKAIDYGFDPIAAIQAVTLNVAEHFGLDHVIGGIAPGKIADLVIIPDPQTIRAEYVISNGRVISQDGELQVSARRHRYSAKSMDTIRLPKKLAALDFKIRADNTPDAVARVRVIDMATDLVTREIIEDLPVFEGEIICPKDSGTAKISAIDRTRGSGKMFTGLIRNFGLNSGALACSAAWDTSCIIVIGRNDADMALAVNRIHDLKGGVVICDNNEIVCELALPVFGIISELPVDQIAQHLEEIKTAAKRLGVDFPDPVLSLMTLTGAAIPYLRICEEGLVNLKDGKTLQEIITRL
ncbi:MAG: adenosine deaminase [Desulfobacterales bacterium RIFOXYA12_FULL_46_15]|nr:MAG: adenosine deaminase [Desulfobacterales bacterium RIFOXYA12_FULL_46_15]